MGILDISCFKDPRHIIASFNFVVLFQQLNMKIMPLLKGQRRCLLHTFYFKFILVLVSFDAAAKRR